MQYEKEKAPFQKDSLNFDLFGNLIWTRSELECLWRIFRHDKVAVFNWFKDATIDREMIIVDNICRKHWIEDKYLFHLCRHHQKQFKVILRETL